VARTEDLVTEEVATTDSAHRRLLSFKMFEQVGSLQAPGKDS
jgi:hypothetical protein